MQNDWNWKHCTRVWGRSDRWEAKDEVNFWGIAAAAAAEIAVDVAAKKNVQVVVAVVGCFCCRTVLLWSNSAPTAAATLLMLLTPIYCSNTVLLNFCLLRTCVEAKWVLLGCKAGWLDSKVSHHLAHFTATFPVGATFGSLPLNKSQKLNY